MNRVDWHVVIISKSCGVCDWRGEVGVAVFINEWLCHNNQ